MSSVTRRSVVTAAAAIGLAACAPGSGRRSPETATSQQAGEPTHLVVWGWLGDQVDNFNEKIFPAFTRQHPQVTVEYRAFPADSYETQLSTGLAGSKGPDVVTLQAYGILQKHIDAGRLLELDETNVPDLAKFVPFVLDGARSDKSQKIFGVPFAVQTAGIFYNATLFRERKLAPPATWTEFVQLCDTLLSSGTTPLSWNFKDTWETPLYHEIFGGAIYGSTQFQDNFMAGKAKFTDQEFVNSIAVLESLKAYLPTSFTALGYSDATTLFTSGRAAMVPDGVWNLTSLRAGGIDVGFFPAPPGPDAVVREALTTTYVDGSFGVNVGSPHRAEALALVNWMASPEFGQLFSDVLGQISAVPGVEAKDPIVKATNDSATRAPEPYFCYTKLNGGNPPGDQLMSQNIQQLLLGKLSPAEAAANVQRGIDQWFPPQR